MQLRPIPEPASLMVWSLLGALGIVVWRRRSKRCGVD
ncbi:MAG: PEP-CTERM sorting domain-containing protein [Planctomycetota bacterium]